MDQSQNQFPAKFVDQNLCPINPFWADFPHCDIFSSMTPNLLHELHNGVFGDQLSNGPRKRQPAETRTLPILRCHFTRGISLTSQWTGNERKNMEKVFLGILAQATNPAVQRQLAPSLTYLYAHFETHCDESLSRLDAAWAAFHKEKSIFLELKSANILISTNFTNSNIMLILSVLARLHIDFAKAGYRATNKVHYTRQMTVWLARQEAVYKFGTYLQWAIPGYIADSANDADNNDLEEEEEGSRSGPPPPTR
ncbi:hypothetical protein B0H14DRAFT_3092254 [Mycena olivaceomarginata]|nr:hypothetical protein B0H14DRAFT_3092254 [Mycena olivaceomarginata]